MAAKAVDTGAGVLAEFVVMVFVLAQLADSFKSGHRDRLDAFHDLDSFGIAEAGLRLPNSTIDVNPTVSGSSLQRLARDYRPVMRQLLTAVFGSHPIGKLFLQSFLFLFPVCFLLVRDLWWLDQIDQCFFGQAQAA